MNHKEWFTKTFNLDGIDIDENEYNYAYSLHTWNAALENQWISVVERLPDKGQRVIARDMGVIGPATYDSGVWWSNVTGLHNITHWIPVPPLPPLPGVYER